MAVPAHLVDRWLTESAYNGLLSDRLAIVGSDDPLLYRLTLAHTAAVGPHALVSYFPTGTGMGLKLLQMRRADACCIHWGPDAESHLRHPALLKQYRQADLWVLVHLFRREQGLMIHPDKLQQLDSHDLPSLFPAEPALGGTPEVAPVRSATCWKSWCVPT
ncbi:MAG: substrate-binding domain-containing protein [Thiolinea sp.]